MNENRSRTEREPIESRTENERRMIRKIYHQNCWLDCDTVSQLLIFLELIKVDFGTFLLDDDLHNTRQKPSAYKDFTAECRTLSDVLFENHFVAYTHNSLFESCHCRRDLDNSKINHPCSIVPHSFILRSIPYCFRFPIGERQENDTGLIRKRYGCLLSIKACYNDT